MPKLSVGESFTVAIFTDSEKVWIGGGEFQDFPSKVFCLTVPKISAGETFTVALFSGIGIVGIRMWGVSRFSIENFMSHRAEKFLRGVLHCCISFGY